MMKAGDGIIGHQGGVRQRNPDRPAAKKKHIDKRGEERGRQNELRQDGRQPLSKGTALARCSPNRRECRGLDHGFLRPSPASGRRDVVRWYYCCASTASAKCLAASAADRLGVLTNS